MGFPGQAPSTRLLALDNWNLYQVLAARVLKVFIHPRNFFFVQEKDLYMPAC